MIVQCVLLKCYTILGYSTETVLLISPFLQTNITVQMRPSGGGWCTDRQTDSQRDTEHSIVRPCTSQSQQYLQTDRWTDRQSIDRHCRKNSHTSTTWPNMSRYQSHQSLIVTKSSSLLFIKLHNTHLLPVCGTSNFFGRKWQTSDTHHFCHFISSHFWPAPPHTGIHVHQGCPTYGPRAACGPRAVSVAHMTCHQTFKKIGPFDVSGAHFLNLWQLLMILFQIIIFQNASKCTISFSWNK